MRVLLAEDDAVHQRLALTLLEDEGHTVKVASNGRQAPEAMRQHNFDIILTDLQMPVMDGVSTARQIRKSEQITGGHVPILAMTAQASEHDRLSCLRAGMDDLLTKPIPSWNPSIHVLSGWLLPIPRL